MDVGSYAVHLARFVVGEEPRVRSAKARLTRPDVDGRMDAVLEYPSGTEATLACSIVERLWNFRFTLKVVGTEGTLNVTNPWAPQMAFHSITVVDKGGRKRRDVVSRTPSTYVHQLRAFSHATTDPAAFPATEALRTMEIIDQLYSSAGLPLRGKSPA
jgi:predicted dehydrogenase